MENFSPTNFTELGTVNMTRFKSSVPFYAMTYTFNNTETYFYRGDNITYCGGNCYDYLNEHLNIYF